MSVLDRVTSWFADVKLRPTVRLRLTLVYGGLFLVAGALLLAVNYLLVRNSLDRDPVFRVEAPAELPDVIARPLPGPLIEGVPVALEEFERKVRDTTLRTLLLQSGQALVLMAVASIGLGWVVAGRVLTPIHQMTAKARRMSEQNLDERIALQGPEDELKELADTFDALLGRLEAAFDSQRRFVANASHELRTPLSIIRTEIDVALADPDASREQLRATAEVVRDATDRCERLVDSLLVLARSDRGLATTDVVDLGEVAAEVAAQSAGAASGAGVDLALDVSPVLVAGDRPLLERLVANLVENGIRYNHPGGRVEVAVFAAGAEAVLRVANTGPPVPPDQVDGLFEPFRRLGAERTRGARRGVGLGLSIVRSVARAHGGSVRGRARTEGGLEVEARLPARRRVDPEAAGAAGVSSRSDTA